VNNRKPGFFIVGAPKCGTTALDHYLAKHPDVFMARKEMHCFGSDLRFSPQFYRRDEKTYLAEFDAARDSQLAGEASVWYLRSESAATEIKAFNPDARIIIMLRNPSDMLHSLYHQFRFDGNEQLPSFLEALDAEQDRRAGRRLGRQHYFVQGLVYRDNARYSQQVKRYLDVFGHDRVHVIIYDDFAANPEAVYGRTLDFLGLKPLPLQNGLSVINGNKQIKNPLLRAVLNDPFVRRALLAIRPCLPGPVFSLLHGVEARLRHLNTLPAGRDPLPADIRHRLDMEFAPDVGQLAILLRRDLCAWGSGKAAAQDDMASALASGFSSALPVHPQPVAVAA
jgi:Sulfotransferase domain